MFHIQVEARTQSMQSDIKKKWFLVDLGFVVRVEVVQLSVLIVKIIITFQKVFI